MDPQSKIIQPIANGATGEAPIVIPMVPRAAGETVNPVLTTEIYDPVSKQGLDAQLNDISTEAQAQAAQIAGIEVALPKKMGMVRGWGNASPSSTFPAQDVAIVNRADYDYFLVISNYLASDPTTVLPVIVKNTVDRKFACFNGYGDSTGYRVGTVTVNGISFNAGNGPSPTIPLEIIGIKGVQS